MQNVMTRLEGTVSETLYRHFPGESDFERLQRLVIIISSRAALDTRGHLKNELARLKAELERVSQGKLAH